MIALGGPKLKPANYKDGGLSWHVSMIALGGPKLKQPGNYSEPPLF